MTHDREARRRTISTAAGLTVGALAYLLTLVDFSTRLTRTANGLGYASNFFDHQARALLDGDLAVPEGSLGIEGFVRDGREYLYFPLWPAVLRLPILVTTDEYDGKLTVFSMALAFAVFALMTTRLVWLVRDLMYPDRPVSRFEAVVMAVFLALATGGTTLTYVASLPWVYHEVYAWSVAFVVGAMYWMLRLARSPRPAAVAWLFVFDLGAVMTRTTGGWAVCLVTVALGLWLARRRRADLPRADWSRRWGTVAMAAGVLALLAGVVLNWVKFEHPFLFPLQDQVWTEVNQHRQEALDANGGTITGLQFFATAFMAYLRLDGIRFVDHFPFITLPAEPAQAYGGAFIDQAYRTGSVPAFMPLLLALSLLALVVLLRRGQAPERRWLLFPLVAGVLVPGGVMAYGYFAYRYTAEFVPPLVLGGAIGCCALTHLVQRTGRRWLAGTWVAAAAVLTAYSVSAQMLVGHSASALTAGGPRLAEYVATQHALTPGAQAELVTFSDDLPSGGRTDDLWIRGDCDALYLNSGDAYDRWLLVERRALRATVMLASDAGPGRVELFRVETATPRTVWLQLDRRGRARIQLVNETGTYSGAWFEILEPRVIRVGVRDLPELGYAEVSSTPGGFIGLVRTFQWDEDWVSRPVELRHATTNPAELETVGLSVDQQDGLAPPLCRRIQHTAQAAQAPAAR